MGDLLVFFFFLKIMVFFVKILGFFGWDSMFFGEIFQGKDDNMLFLECDNYKVMSSCVICLLKKMSMVGLVGYYVDLGLIFLNLVLNLFCM